ncbi:hypothetical protein ACFX11_038047 [Malus domestica]
MVFFKCFKNNTITILAKECDLRDRGATLKLYAPLTGPTVLVLLAKDNLMHIKSWSSKESWEVMDFSQSTTKKKACTSRILISNPSHHARDNSPALFKLLGDRVSNRAMTWNGIQTTIGEAIFAEFYCE